MAKLRQLYAVKNDKPETLTIFIAYQVHKTTFVVTPVRVVQRDRRSLINVNNGGVLTIGSDAYFDPIDAINVMVDERRKQIAAIEASLAEIEEFRKRVIAAKEGEKKNAK